MTHLLNCILLMAPAQSGKGGGFMSMLPLLLIIVIFYFFMIRPQMKRSKELRKFISELKKGDKVLTTGGIHGKITEIQETTVTLEVESGASMRVEKSAIINDPSSMPQSK